MRALLSTAVLCLAVTNTYAGDAHGDPFMNEGFMTEDWQLVCDNTLTCRAAGYGLENPATILLTVIPKAAAKAKLQLGSTYIEGNAEARLKQQGYRVELRINDRSYGMIQLDFKTLIGSLSAYQTQQLIDHARKNTKITITAGTQNWEVRDGGMAAVLLKLDEVQGRIGTPLALVSKNASVQQSPIAARPKPIIKAAPAYGDDEAAQRERLDSKKLAYFKANINSWVDTKSSSNTSDSCELLDSNDNHNNNSEEWQFRAIDQRHTLASHECWTAAYNYGIGYWVIDHATPSTPKLVTLSATSYQDGIIWNYLKGRGVGDCIFGENWVWNGDTFIKAHQMTTGMCRAITGGGTWGLATYVSDIVDSKGHAINNKEVYQFFPAIYY